MNADKNDPGEKFLSRKHCYSARHPRRRRNDTKFHYPSSLDIRRSRIRAIRSYRTRRVRARARACVYVYVCTKRLRNEDFTKGLNGVYTHRRRLRGGWMERRRRSNLRALHKYANARAPEEGQMTGGGEGSSGGRDACTCILYTRKGVRSNAGAMTRCSGGGEDAAVAEDEKRTLGVEEDENSRRRGE